MVPTLCGESNKIMCQERFSLMNVGNVWKHTTTKCWHSTVLIYITFTMHQALMPPTPWLPRMSKRLSWVWICQKENDKYLCSHHEYVATRIEVICALYVVTLLCWIPILYLSPLYMARVVVKNKHKNTCVTMRLNFVLKSLYSLIWDFLLS
jgi:hypothetical protein